MKPLFRVISLVFVGAFSPLFAQAESSSTTLLQQMEQASQSLNYQLSFINVSRFGIESMRYRHASANGKVYAQLLQLDGPRREIIQRGKEISYFEPGLEPFSLAGDHIIDSLPSLVYADFTKLARSYNYIAVGRTRVADHFCEVIRIVARDGTRYGYIVWIDSESKLPLRADLVDGDGETLEQYRVVDLDISDALFQQMQGLDNSKLPPVISVPGSDKASFDWQVQWLPDGVKEVAQSRRLVPALNKGVESRLYSDGLFSFSVNVSLADKNSTTQLLRTGRRTVQSVVRNNIEITLVGEVPPTTAKRIVDNVILRNSP
ncbi:MAG: Sigma-E factor regulatory protein RseB [Candidatus Erwinia impunctatus]|nr:Sigma-E factor regulatory protein RseB [Culicoides impunctatus]